LVQGARINMGELDAHCALLRGPTIPLSLRDPHNGLVPHALCQTPIPHAMVKEKTSEPFYKSLPNSSIPDLILQMS